MSARTLSFLGGGNMAYAMIRGLVSAGFVAAPDVCVVDPVDAQRAKLEAELGVVTRAAADATAGSADVVVLAVKPQVMGPALAGLVPHLGATSLVVSIAAGVTLSTLEGALGEGRRVVRTMPNTPALVSASATGIAGGRHATAADVELVKAMFGALGEVAVVSESLLDAVTGLSGSGPAYVMLFIEALADGGVRAGLPRDAALRLAAQTVLGSAKLLLESGQHPGVLKDQVTSPGGTTIAGVHALERGGLRASVMDAVVAATERARELGTPR